MKNIFHYLLITSICIYQLYLAAMFYFSYPISIKIWHPDYINLTLSVFKSCTPDRINYDKVPDDLEELKNHLMENKRNYPKWYTLVKDLSYDQLNSIMKNSSKGIRSLVRGHLINSYNITKNPFDQVFDYRLKLSDMYVIYYKRDQFDPLLFIENDVKYNYFENETDMIAISQCSHFIQPAFFRIHPDYFSNFKFKVTLFRRLAYPFPSNCRDYRAEGLCSRKYCILKCIGSLSIKKVILYPEMLSLMKRYLNFCIKRDCQQIDCNELSINTETIYSSKLRNLSIIKVSLANSFDAITLFEECPQINLIQLIVNIASILGLWFGFNVLNMIQIVQSLVQRKDKTTRIKVNSRVNYSRNNTRISI